MLLSDNKFYQMNQELFLRDDIIDLSNRLDSQNYNIKAYRKRNMSQTNRNHKNFIVSTEIITSDFHEDLRVDKSVDKTQRTTEILSARRLSATAGVRKRSNLNNSEFPGFTKTARTKNNSMLQDPITYEDRKDKTIVNMKIHEPKQLLKGNFSKHEKEFAKTGQLKNKHLENWLNQILLQYCHEQKFDTTIENPALKKYGVDKNSLLSKGINPENLQRIYKSLFVYSMGFNTLLKQIGGKNMGIRKTFWKVYAILLQYCSDGDFDTMIGEIERDKIRKMEIMKDQIEKRQQIIQNNEDIHQQKNAKIFKELKQLREENTNLQNDKNVIMEDYKQAQQAFNQEVSLRLKFENKINEIHGVHRQLAIKHQKLYDDLQSKTYQYNSVKEKFTKVTQQYLVLKTQNQFIKKEIATLKEENEYNFLQMDQMKKKFVSHELLQIQWRHKKEQFAIALRQRQKKIEQVKGQLKNCQLMLEMKTKSQEQLQKQYKRSLQQNKQLVNSLQKELDQINVYMLQKKEFNDVHSRLFAEIQIANRQLAEKVQQLKVSKKQTEEIREELHEKDVQIQVLKMKSQHFETDMKDLYSKIGEMKKIKTVIEQQLIQLKSKEDYYKNYYIEKQKLIANLNLKLQENQRTISQFNIAKKTLDSKVMLLTQKLLAQQQGGKKKLEKLKAQVFSLDKQNKTLKKQIQQKLNEVQKATSLYEQTFNKLKDQMFERNDLELRYNQSLSVVQSQTDHIKKLNIKISEMNERLEDMARKLKGVQFILETKEKNFKSQTIQHNALVNQLKEQIKMKKNYIHPMKYQDLLSQLSRGREVLQSFKRKAQIQKLKINAPELHARIHHLQSELFQARINFKEELDRKCKQIEIQKERVRYLQQRNENKIQAVKQSQVQAPKNNFKQKQRKYLEIIKEKSSTIENLLVQVESIHDQNTKLISRLNETQSQLKMRNSKIETFQKKISSYQSEKIALTIEKSNIAKEKERLIAQLSNQQSRILNEQESANNSDGFIGFPSNREIQSQNRSRLQNNSRQSQSRQKNQPSWRNDFTKKVKNAYNYYKK